MSRRAAMPVSLAVMAVATSMALTGCALSKPVPEGSPAASAPVATASASATPVAEDLAYADACFLLAPGNLEAVTGGTWGEGHINQDLSTDYQTICEWYREDAELVFAQVVVTNDPAGYEAQKTNANSTLGDARDITLPGADAAYSALGGAIVGFADGDHFYQVSYIGGGTPEEAGHAAALASIISATS